MSRRPPRAPRDPRVTWLDALPGFAEAVAVVRGRYPAIPARVLAAGGRYVGTTAPHTWPRVTPQDVILAADSLATDTHNIGRLSRRVRNAVKLAMRARQRARGITPIPPHSPWLRRALGLAY